MELADAFCGQVVADDLAEHALVADPTSDKLGGLGAKIEDEYSFVGRVGETVGRQGGAGMRHGYRRVKRGRAVVRCLSSPTAVAAGIRG